MATTDYCFTLSLITDYWSSTRAYLSGAWKSTAHVQSLLLLLSDERGEEHSAPPVQLQLPGARHEHAGVRARAGHARGSGQGRLAHWTFGGRAGFLAGGKPLHHRRGN